MINKAEISSALPELEQITDLKLRAACVDAFAEAMELGGWTDLNALAGMPVLPVDKAVPGRIEFIREVAALAADEYDELINWIDELAPCDKDTIIASALLADIGLYVRSGPAPVQHAEFYNKAEWAGYLAQKNGLPPKVVYILLTVDPVMAPEGTKAIFTNELRFVRSSYYTLLAALA